VYKGYVYSYGQDYPYTTFYFTLSYFNDVWDPHARAFFNLTPRYAHREWRERREQPRPRGGALPLP
jgi:hypothetical protein